MLPTRMLMREEGRLLLRPPHPQTQAFWLHAHQIARSDPMVPNRDGIVRDAQARVVRALEALRDGDREFAEQVLDDLAHELWEEIERQERAS